MGKLQLVGTWKLLSVSATNSSGERDEHPYGLHPSGVLTYGSDGRVTALISYDGRKRLSPDAPPQEKAEAFNTFIAYAGRYAFDGNQVTHYVELSSIQNYVGRDLVRSVRVETDDRIVLVTPPTPVNGKMLTFELVWQRLAASTT